MAQVYFNTRAAARQATFGKMVDNGTQSPKGKRFARELVTLANRAKTLPNPPAVVYFGWDKVDTSIA